MAEALAWLRSAETCLREGVGGARVAWARGRRPPPPPPLRSPKLDIPLRQSGRDHRIPGAGAELVPGGQDSLQVLTGLHKIAGAIGLLGGGPEELRGAGLGRLRPRR